MAVIRSGFEYDMGIIVDGFISDPNRTEEENEAVFLGLIEVAEEPGVDSRGCLKTRWSRLPTVRAYEPNLGMKAHVIS
jgi:hypothetical protein